MSTDQSLHILLATIGSAGDVHPFVGLGQTLRRRGHRVSILTGAYFQPLVERAGLEFVELFSAEKYREMIDNPDLWHPVRGAAFVMKHGIAAHIRTVYERIAERYEPGRTVVGASSLAIGAIVAQEKLGVPTATIHLQPAMIRSVAKPPKLVGMMTQEWLPRPMIAGQYWLADKIVDRLIEPEFNGFRRTLGLPPVHRFFNGWLHSPTLTFGLFPPWFAPPQPDWPPQIRLTGFPLYDEGDHTPLGADVEEFLAAGTPPIAFTPGSAMTFGQSFFAAAVDACKRLNRRGILLTRHAEQIPQSLPPEVRHFAFVPFTKLLPRCAALVHHGGIGTMSQALAAGLPQVVMPLSHDQPDNIERAERLGVGAALYPKKFTGARLAPILGRLLESPDVAKACRDVATKIAGTTPLEDAADLMEGLAR
jgi:UDP:flavonoid glycosyltransferase YjiC (YdhE family)